MSEARVAANADVVEFENRLAHVEGTAALYFSLWMRGIDDAMPYRDVWPQRAEPLRLATDIYPEPLPVVADSASITYLRSRRVEYLPQLYRSEHSGQQRVRIRGVRVTRAPAAGDAIEMSMPDFLERYLAQRYIEPSDDDDDDDATSVKRVR